MTKGQKLEALEVLRQLLEEDIKTGRASETLRNQHVTDAVEQQNMEAWLLWTVQDLIIGVLQ